MTGGPESQMPMQSLLGRRVVLGITGSIAAYKSAFLARELIRRGAKVRVVMTPSATEFITPLTLATLVDNPVHSDFTENKDKGTWTNHVELGLWGDLFLIAPCTAQTMSAMVNGVCDNLLQAVFLSARCPVMIAPAMDLDMFTNEATQQSLQTLQERGIEIIEPASGPLASGLEGKGRLEEPEIIAGRVEDFFDSYLPLKGKKIVVTAGPTQEPIDAVRYIGNRSSGKMGFALAGRLADLGAEVTLISGPVTLDTPPRVANRININTAQDLFEAAMEVWPNMDAGIACAAVADLKPIGAVDRKIHKDEFQDAVELEKTPDTLASMGSSKCEGQILMGFALETDDGVDSAMGKLDRKNLDFVVINTLADDGAGFSHDTNKVTVIKRVGVDTEMRSFELKSKKEVARDLIDMLFEIK